MNPEVLQGRQARKVLFVHDGPIHVAPDGVPRGVHYTEALIRRYLLLGDQLTFMLRSVPIPQQAAGGYSPLVHEQFRFVSVPNVKTVVGMLRDRRRAMQIVRDEVSKCDVLVARLPSTIGRWAYNEAKRQRKPVLVEFMACTWDALWNNRFSAKLVAPYYYLKNRILLRNASHVVYVTEKFLQCRYPTFGKSIGCSNVIVERGDESTVKRRFSRISNYLSGRRIVLATIAGVDVPYKNQAAVILALRHIGKGRERFVYRIIGPGNPEKLVALAARLGVSDCIEIMGSVAHAEIPDMLDDTDIYIQPSRMEGLPRAMIEAMSRGCAVIGARTGGIPELIESKYIFNPGDVAHLARLIVQWNPRTLEGAAVRNMNAATNYTADVLEARRASFYAEFLADYGVTA